MKSNDELKEISIENRTCYYFYDPIKIEDLYFNRRKIIQKYFSLQHFAKTFNWF